MKVPKQTSTDPWRIGESAATTLAVGAAARRGTTSAWRQGPVIVFNWGKAQIMEMGL